VACLRQFPAAQVTIPLRILSRFKNLHLKGKPPIGFDEIGSKSKKRKAKSERQRFAGDSTHSDDKILRVQSRSYAGRDVARLITTDVEPIGRNWPVAKEVGRRKL
jgi:hypothetical protein